MDYKKKVFAELSADVKDIDENNVTGVTIQTLLWEGIYEERVYLDDKRVFSRLCDEKEEGWSTPFTEVKPQENK